MVVVLMQEFSWYGLVRSGDVDDNVDVVIVNDDVVVVIDGDDVVVGIHDDVVVVDIDTITAKLA